MALLVRAGKRTNAVFSGLLLVIVAYGLGYQVTMLTLPSISPGISSEHARFAEAALSQAGPCFDWPLAKPFTVKYQIARVLPVAQNELRAELRVFSVYRLRIATIIVNGHRDTGDVYGCTHSDYSDYADLSDDRLPESTRALIGT